MNIDVIGLGALNLDRLYRVGRIAREGEQVPIQDVSESPGGSAANTIAGLSDLGLKTGFLGAVGKDGEGKIMLESFRKCGVDTKGVAVLNGRTGIVVGFIDKNGERTLYPYPGANSLLGFKDIDLDYASKAKYLHYTSFVDVKQLSIQKKLVQELPDLKISFGPGMLYSRLGLKTLMPIIKRSSVVFLNQAEIKELTGREYAEGCGTLLDNGAEAIAITLGSKGCYVTDGRKSHHIPAGNVKVIDTTGAGDAFAAGFLYTMIKGGSVLDAGKHGNKTASLCIQKVGARTWLPCARDL